jgi:hypothetical protein
MQRYRHTALVLAASAALIAVPIAAQTPAVATAAIASRHDANVATVMRVASLDKPGARALIVRRPGNPSVNVILVTTETAPEDLSRAISALMVSRRTRGEAVAKEMRAYIQATTNHREKTTPAAGGEVRVLSANHQRAAADLGRLAAARHQTLEGVGRGQVISIRMKN